MEEVFTAVLSPNSSSQPEPSKTHGSGTTSPTHNYEIPQVTLRGDPPDDLRGVLCQQRFLGCR